MDLSPDEEDFQGRLLHQAALWDNLELLSELLSGGAAVDARDAHARTPLHAAALAERSRCLRALCAAGADVDAVSDVETGGKTALHISAERGHVENVSALLSAGAALGARDAAGDTARALADRNNHRHASIALRDAQDAQERERLHAHAQLRELVTRGDVTQLKSKLQSLGSAAELVVNLTPGGANTLLYIASESGSAPLVSCLIEAGADGRAHPVTRYGPLYAAAYHGHGDVARILLDHFPEAVKQETVEKWLPLHAACMGGHGPMVALLLEYPYPQRVMETYTARCGSRYQFPFDVNAVDARGRSALLAAAARPALAALDALLLFNVPALAGEQQCEEDPPGIEPVTSPHRSGISLGIHAIVTKLTGGNQRPSPSPRRLRPVRLELAARGDSAVGAAARAGDLAVLQRLLNAGAAADAPAAHPLSSEQADGIRRRSRSADPRGHATDYCDPDVPWTALAAACAGGHAGCAGALLAAGAADPHGAALRHAAARRLTDLMAAILATKAQADPEHKLCRSLVASRVFSRRGADAALTYAALGPSTPVAIHWRDLKCHLASIRMSWVRQAALAVNPRLCGAGAAAGALLAVTRIDVSNNELRLLPHEIFGMMSLRYLNAAGNKLERLPTPSDPGEEEGAGWRARGRSKRNANTNIYTAPLLQEVYLQDNRLPWLPPALFLLPALQSLDVSNNKLRALPPALWAAPALRDLNAALNHLRDLPHGEEDDESPRSPEEGRSPVTSPSTTLSMSSRSASSDQEDATSQHPDDVPTLGNRGGNAVWSESRRAHSWRGAVEAPRAAPGRSALTSLNVSHNQFTQLPPALACRAPNLTRLNMAYNSLRSMSYVTSYPTNLRQLDLSHNEITCWPSLPQLESVGSAGESPLSCYCPGGAGSVPPSAAGGVGASRASVRERLLRAACPARSHLRLNALRTLILSNNLLTRIQLTTDDDGTTPELPEQDTPNEEDEEWNSSSSIKARLVFPLLSMLDVSNNLLKAVPPSIHLLTNLSVLNISGNKDVTELPPAMGLLSRLWSLSAGGCALGEPLRSMVRGGHYKSADVVGYLRSVLHAATKYSRMRLMLVGNQGIGKTSLLECLRQESAIQHRRKPTDHWAKRMGNKTSRRNMSTVGVDIGQWTYEKNRSTRGPVTFRTWDFGGQQEYYATHQYFLSRRSLYLVVWKLSDGRKGLAPALSWLRSIQARAPGSPVIMVATHYDQVANSSLSECESPESLQRLIRCSIMAAPDADKLGLPRVMDSIEVSCSTRHNIRLLADIIYSVAFSVKPPGSKEPLLEQRIPASYLALEECVTSDHVTEPVLTHNEYKKMVTNYMQQKNLKGFRDAAELHQATMFLHENGVLLHYDDATLKELYFLRPQWLCDMLAHVVTVREINPFANNGIMKVEDLAHVFKASPSLWASEEASGLGVSLLQKFELALCWDARTLLVPPLLPQSPPAHPQLPVRSRSWSNRRPWSAPAPSVPLTFTDNRHTDSPTLIQESCGVSVAGRDGGGSCARALALTYAPGGLCARLCARLLADPALAAAPRALYCPHELSAEETLRGALEAGWGWKVWRRGAALLCGGLLVLSVTERPPSADPLLAGYTETEKGPYDNIRFRVRQEESWCEMELSSYTCIEILLPAQVCVIKRDDGLPIAGYQSISVEPNPEVLARILAIVSDHIDLLLEDWYPALGTRFVHTSEGKCLITRVIPCPACLKDVQRLDQQDLAQQAMHRLELAADPPPRVSQDSRASDGDSGVGHESNASSRLGSVDGVVDCGPWALAHAWTVEHCILLATTQGTVHCPQHGDMALRQLAPDLLLLDVEESRRARWEHITLRGVLGRGAFGTVFTAVWRAAPGPAKGAAPGAEQAVALKVLQPVPPPPGSDAAALQAYKACVSRWEREPGAAACRAYLSLRAELGVLRRVRHAHVGALLGVCAAPRALLLERARLALDAALRAHAARGRRPGPRTARALLLQVARALEYLHGNRVVYRDLKSENVLVWRLPSPEESAAAEKHSDPIDVHVKLGDYGISRLAPPSGTKGFGGTEGFMAPEIMRYNGEEEYNEKVDCFSFGMLMYEVVTCRQPYEGHEAVKEAVLEGTRPALSPKELQYPVCLVQTMRRCWAVAASARPSAGALVSLLAAPEACPLRDVAAARPARAAAALQIYVPESESVGWEVWYGGGEPERVHTLVATGDQFTQQYSIRITPDKAEPVLVTAICRVGNAVWLGDSVGRISAYCASTCSLLWVEVVCAVVGGACAGAGDGAGGVAALAPLDSLTPARVAVAMACGRLFLVSADRSTEEGTFVLTELGTATELCALATLPVDDGVSVWAGGCALSVFVSLSEGVASAERAALPAAGAVTLLAAGTGLPHVYGYIQPGVCIYQWCVSSKAVVGRLDCSKLVPCSETLDAGAETHHLPDNCRVLSLAVSGRTVAAGTRRGCVLVADGNLRPLAVCRPYHEDVQVIIPLIPRNEEEVPMIATFGSGYRPLLQRYAPAQNNQTQYNGTYCLLWKTLHWLPD